MHPVSRDRASFFTLILRGFDGPLWSEGLFVHLPGGTIGFLVVINALIFVLAFFLDFFQIAFIVLSRIVPIMDKTGITIGWLVVRLTIDLQTSVMQPPFSIALFNLRSVPPPQAKTRDIYWGAVPFLLIQLAMVALLVAFPGLVTVKRKTDDAAASVPELRLSSPPELEQMDDPPGSVEEAKR